MNSKKTSLNDESVFVSTGVRRSPGNGKVQGSAGVRVTSFDKPTMSGVPAGVCRCLPGRETLVPSSVVQTTPWEQAMATAREAVEKVRSKNRNG
jgi:hypothetical protein